MTPQEFAAKIKEKYPQYASLNDVDLTRRMIEKYPQYKSQVSFERTMPGADIARSALSAIPEAIQAGKDQIVQGYEEQRSATNPLPLITGGIKSAAGVATILSSPLAPVFKPVGSAMEKVGDAIGSIPAVQKFAESKAGRVTEKVADVAADSANILGTFTGIQSGIAKASKIAKAPTPDVPAPFQITKDSFSNPLKKSPEKIIAKRATELKRLEDSYTQIRKVTSKAKKQGVDPLDTLARTDLLKGAVDDTGTIRTQNAMAELNDFIKPHEGVISQALAREGVSITLKTVADRLKKAVYDSGLEGEALSRALDKVDAEVRGLGLRADNKGMLPLAKVQDAKINKYSTIDYTNGAAKIADKSIARALKELVKENTKSVDVDLLNKELTSHYAVLNLLEKLDGKKVDGGKLGKYFASTIGSVVGSHFGPLGSIVGAEAGARIKGSMMSSKFSGKSGVPLQFSDAMKNASQQSTLPPLALPAPKPGAPRTSFPSGKTIPLGARSQSSIDALEAVRQSSKSGNLNQSQIPTMTAVASEPSIISTTLPQKGAVSSPGTKLSRPLKDTNTSTSNALTGRGGVSAQKTDTSGGFEGKLTFTDEELLAKLTPAQRSRFDAGTPKEQAQALDHLRLKYDLEANDGIVGSKAPSTPKSLSPLYEEAKKYKTAEEFVKAQTIVYHGSQKPLKQFSNKYGTFFTDDMMNAEGYAGGENVYEGYLSLKNPLVIDANGALHRELDTQWGKTTKEVVSNVDKSKYDGVIFKNIKDSWIDDAEMDTPSTIYYAFRPKDSFLNESQLLDIWKKANNK